MREISEIKKTIEACREAINRGMLPEGSFMLIEAERDLRAALTASIPLDRLEAICQAEKDGRCVALPCKVGDMVYHVWGEAKENMSISTVTALELRKHGYYVYTTDGVESFRFCVLDTGRNDLGKTVFLTREEAEAAKGGD